MALYNTVRFLEIVQDLGTENTPGGMSGGVSVFRAVCKLTMQTIWTLTRLL